MSNFPSMGVITSIEKDQKKVKVEMQPSGFELGWSECLVPIDQMIENGDCIVIPAQGAYGQSLVIPYPLKVNMLGKLIDLTPSVEIEGKIYNCLTTVVLTSEHIGKQVLVNQVTNDPRRVISGVIV